ncbi:collagen binding domain-containing protein [Gemmatimonas sp.]|jgi:Carboxypeptidase regulatory-like domain/TonB-dependent Receptor Plug Domain|uniref:MSCRAMM family protein n=1 Tax=Gemmatimonas sp. TaxID=1962908 RepID=UPI0027BAA0AD|nr:carboxypeptidase regulatory-like domain-containing protein [Gemmatimonas sp.]
MHRGILALAILAIHAIHAPVAAQSLPQPTLRLAGLVHDSLTGFPLRGAVVQLVEGDGSSGARSVVSDDRGYFRFADLTPGRYRLGFHHPRLDTLGIEAPVRTVQMHADVTDLLLAVPSAMHIRTAVCGAGHANREATLLTGTVYDARTGAAVSDAAVHVEWTEIELAKQTATPRRVQRQVMTGANGWYGVCDVPREGVVQLTVRTPGDSIERVEVRLFDDVLNHQLLYLGSATTARVTGVVTQDGSTRPVADATVSVPNGPEVRTNAKGEFMLDAVPAGSRTLDVRAMGFYPEHLMVNAIEGAPRVDVGLRSFRAVLDTVKVLASYQRYSLRQELADRQRMGIGRFITEQDIARRQPVVLSDLLMATPGVYVTREMGLQQNVSMRGLFTDRCAPSLFLNGFVMFLADFGSAPFSFADLDAMVSPADVLAIEIYASGQVPPVLGAGMTGCGAIAVWTR